MRPEVTTATCTINPIGLIFKLCAIHTVHVVKWRRTKTKCLEPCPYTLWRCHRQKGEDDMKVVRRCL